MKNMKLIIALLFCALMMTACQKTPNSQVVKEKNDMTEMLIEEGVDSHSPAYDAPENWYETVSFDGSDLTVNIDANIYIQDAAPTAIAGVSMQFSQEFADKFLDYFIDDKTIYQINEQRTKSEIEENIISIQLALQRTLENTNTEENSAEFYRQIIDNLKTEWENAPEQLDKIIVERKILPQMPPQYILKPSLKSSDQTDEEYEQELADHLDGANKTIKYYQQNIGGIKGMVDFGHETPAQINIINDINNNQTETYFINFGEYKSITPTGISAEQIDLHNISISLADAVNSADDFLEYAGVSNMHYSFSQVGRLNGYGENNGAQGECYILHFTKSYDGFCETYETSCGMYSESFRMFHKYERMAFWVSDEGIIKFEWTNPIAFDDVLSNNLNLLPFDEVKEIFKQQVKFAYAWGDDESVKSRTYMIDDITLGLMRASQQDNSNRYVYIPVWDFFGYEVYEYEQQEDTKYVLDESNQLIKDRGKTSFLTINATDGTVIDRTKGY